MVFLDNILYVVSGSRLTGLRTCVKYLLHPHIYYLNRVYLKGWGQYLRREAVSAQRIHGDPLGEAVDSGCAQ